MLDCCERYLFGHCVSKDLVPLGIAFVGHLGVDVRVDGHGDVGGIGSVGDKVLEGLEREERSSVKIYVDFQILKENFCQFRTRAKRLIGLIC